MNMGCNFVLFKEFKQTNRRGYVEPVNYEIRDYSYRQMGEIISYLIRNGIFFYDYVNYTNGEKIFSVEFLARQDVFLELLEDLPETEKTKDIQDWIKILRKGYLIGITL
ncbi:MAG: hypothetical protein ACFFD4_34055 [Candidatus Odinarchaeota archaeon]